MNYWIVYDISTGAFHWPPYLGTATQWTNIPTGCAVLGPIAVTDTTAQAAFANPQNYSVVNGVLTMTATSAQLLTQAQQAQLQVIAQGYAATIAAGFTSGATGTEDTYAIDASAFAKWTGILATINAGIAPSSINVKDIAGKQATLTSAQFKTFALDGFNFLNAQEQQLWALEAEIGSATTISAVQAIVWTAATYTHS